MSLHIRHTYCTHVVIYYDRDDYEDLSERLCDNMDDIAEYVCERLIKHNFSRADICSAETGEVLMVVERT